MQAYIQPFLINTLGNVPIVAICFKGRRSAMAC